MPYIKILLPSIWRVLFDAIPDIRTLAAKSLAKLTLSIGLQNSKDIISKLKFII